MVKIVNLPKFLDERGNLSFLENKNQIPFEIKRVYWIYDVPGGEIRDGHAFKTNHEIIIALSGSFDVTVDDGSAQTTFHLNRSYYGLYVPNMIFRHMDNFSTNSVAFVLSSIHYDESDYIHDYDAFKMLIQ